MSDWQPIETAPRDETWVLLAWATGTPPWQADSDMVIAFWSEEFQGWFHNEAASNAVDELRSPTHWIPLPEPPKEKPMTDTKTELTRDLKTEWERRADLEAEERRMQQIKEADAGKKP